MSRLTLTEIADKHGTDKGNAFHLYTDRYAEILEPMRDRVRAVLELGVLEGGSLRTWAEYFPNATVYGLDHQPQWLIIEPRITTAWADCGDPSSIQAALRTLDVARFDLVIDDASHKFADQTAALRTLAPHVMPGGVYIVEDAEVEGFVDDPLEVPGFRWERVDAAAEGSVGRSVVYRRV